jgi:hypothetical protein
MNSKIQLLGASGALTAAVAIAAFLPIEDAHTDSRAFGTSVPDEVPNTYRVEDIPKTKAPEKPSVSITVAPITVQKVIQPTPTPTITEKVREHRHRRSFDGLNTNRTGEVRESGSYDGRPSGGRHRDRTSSRFFTRR